MCVIRWHIAFDDELHSARSMHIRGVHISTFVKKSRRPGLIWFSEVLRVQWYHFFQDLICSRGSANGLKFMCCCKVHVHTAKTLISGKSTRHKGAKW